MFFVSQILLYNNIVDIIIKTIFLTEKLFIYLELPLVMYYFILYHLTNDED